MGVSNQRGAAWGCAQHGDVQVLNATKLLLFGT